MTTSYSVIGRSVTREEGPDKVSGSAIYPADVVLPGILWGKVLRSPYPHARILNIDTSKARQVPGVHAVITGKDLLDSNVGRLLRDCPVLARDRVRFVGEKVAAVAAETEEAAEEALLLIEVEYDEMPAVFDSLDAMEPSAPTLHMDMASYPGLPQPASKVNNVFAENHWTKGDVEQGFLESDLIFEHTFTAQLMHQAYIEPHACVAKVDDSGRVEIWANNKGPFMLREQVAEACGIPQESITVYPCNIGGDFGGKGSFMDVPLCYYLALHAQRPVKLVMSYIQELMAANPRHPATITLKTGVKKDGRLWARQAKVVFNSGAYGAYKPRVHLRGADHAGGAYLIPHVNIESYMVYTNNVPCGHMRAPGKPQVLFAVESHMDMIAQELGLDPYEFRMINILKDGQSTPVGEDLQDIRAEETLRQAAQAAGWDRPKEKPYVGRGIAISDQATGTGQSAAKAAMDEHGKVDLFMSLFDTGTGAHTILRQLVAEELTIPVEDVRMVVEDTNAVPYDSGSGGTRVTYTNGRAALGAATELKKLLVTRTAELFESTEGQITLENGNFIIRVTSIQGTPMQEALFRTVPLNEVAARVFSATREPMIGEMTYASTTPEITSYCAQVAEVEVDPETGEVKVNKIVTAHDVGTILNPLTHQGQIDGGVIQGLGYALMEELTTEEGRISTLSLGDYKIPTMPDIPQLETVLLEPAIGPAPFQSKGIGESSNVPVAGAIANAVYDAVGARILDLPITSEKVLRALKEKQK